MTRKAAVLLVAAAPVLITRAAAERARQGQIPLHHFELACERCHEPEPAAETLTTGTVAGDSVPEKVFGRLRASANELCTAAGCHTFDPMMSHPVGIVPTAPVPVGMPLDESRRIMCLTCHQAPAPSPASQREDLAGGPVLHKPAGIDFCGRCHLQMPGSISTQSHWQIAPKAHLISTAARAVSLTAGYAGPAGVIDAESRACLGCHDDINVVIVPYSETRQQKMARRGRTTGHPIGMDYQRMAVSRTGRLNFPLGGSSRVRLFDGRLGCGTCHSFYSNTPNSLVEPYETGILCKKCHNLP